MKELRLGRMENKEIAEWFGLSLSYFRKVKEKKLNELENYAIFNAHKGFVDILHIEVAVYIKEKNNNYKTIKSKIDDTWDESGIDSKKHVAAKIYNQQITDLAETTTYSYVCKASNELYGPPNRNNKGGEIGTCHKVTAVEEYDTGIIRLLTPEEEALRRSIKNKYFCNFSKDEADKESYALQYANGEISKRAYDILVLQINEDQSNKYIQYAKALQEAFYPNIVFSGIYKELYPKSAF